MNLNKNACRTTYVYLDWVLSKIQQTRMQQHRMRVSHLPCLSSPTSSVSTLIDQRDIIDAHTLGKNIDTIMVKFSNNAAKNAVISTRTKLKGTTPAIYINEDLTKKRADLYKLTRSLVKEKKIHAAWSRNGKIFVKNKSDSTPYVIHQPLSSE